MGKAQRDISFNKFIDSVKKADIKDFTEANFSEKQKSEIKVKSNTHFLEMRQHILDHYSNTEVVKSFQDEKGQVWDCFPINKQPSQKNNKDKIISPPRLSMANLNSINHDKNKRLSSSFLSETKLDEYGNTMSCPEGCVPVRRLTPEEMIKFETLHNFLRKTPKYNKVVGLKTKEADSIEAHKYAHAAQQINNSGGHSFLSINKPVILNDQVFSLSQHWYTAGDGDSLQTLEVGWQIYPGKYRTTNPCLFIYYTADNYQQTGAYNLENGAFVQVSNKWALGGSISSIVNEAGAVANEIEITWALTNGKWWLYINGTDSNDAVGYYPINIYQGGQMGTHSTYIDYGGETVGSNTWPQMGNGKFPQDDVNNAAYQRSINYFDLNGEGQWAELTAYEDFPNCYKIDVGSDEQNGPFFYYGGPGGDSC